MLISTLGLLYLFFWFQMWLPFLQAIEDVAINVVAPPPIAIEGVHWARDGPKFVCTVDGCDALYISKYNLVQHLRAHHNVTMDLGKLEHPSICEHGNECAGLE
jgi:hypothetical protein